MCLLELLIQFLSLLHDATVAALRVTSVLSVEASRFICFNSFEVIRRNFILLRTSGSTNRIKAKLCRKKIISFLHQTRLTSRFASFERCTLFLTDLSRQSI
jgi:hypothetical protein